MLTRTELADLYFLVAICAALAAVPAALGAVLFWPTFGVLIAFCAEVFGLILLSNPR